MPSGLRKTTGNHFEIYYEQPWGGVASDKDPVDIAENQLVVQQGIIESTGVLNTVLLQKGFSFTPIAPNVLPVLFWVQNQVIYTVDQASNIYFLSGGVFTFVTTVAGGPLSILNPPSAVIVINGIAYISNYNLHSIYTFDGVVTFALASNYTGGRILGVVDDYLLQINTNNIVDGPQPMRINWSGPGEFTTWDPSIDRSAGFNTLAGTEDEITGFFSLASVGLAITKKSLVELSPTGVAIGPFDFTALWTSQVGQGCVYPYSVNQYGMLGYLANETGVYNVSTGAGFSEISGSAREAILTELNTAAPADAEFPYNPNVAGTVLLYFYNMTYATPYYVLATLISPLPPDVPPKSVVLSLWFYNIRKGTWANLKYNVDDLVFDTHGVIVVGAQAFNLSIVSLGQAIVFGDLGNFGDKFNTPITIFSFSAQVGATTYPVILLGNLGATSFARVPALNMTFRPEELKLGFTRKPTIRRAVIKASGTGTLHINVVDVTGVSISLGDIAVVSGSPNTYYTTKGVATVEDPQLVITSTNFVGKIIKVMLAGTYADGEID